MRQARNNQLILWTILTGIIATIVILHGEKVVSSPYGRFTNDSLNYADVARNILRGRGVTQSAIGFNEARLAPDLPSPMPMTSQPPLYPLLVALLAFVGMPIPTASLFISVTGMGVVILAGALLAWQLYGESAGMLALIGLLTFAPLYYVTDRAWSDTLATGLALISMNLFTQARRANTLAPVPLFLGGIAAGLAFTTRYAFLPLILVGGLVLLRPKDRRCTLRSLELFLSGAVLVTGMVIARNLWFTRTITGTPRNPSTRGLLTNLQDVYNNLFSTYLGDPFYSPTFMRWAGLEEGIPPAVTIGILLGWIALLFLVLLVRRRWFDALVAHQRFLPIAWAAAYLGFLILQRTLIHFDNINSRLVFPGSVMLPIWLAGLLARAVSPRPQWLIYPVLLLASFGLVQAWNEARGPEMTLQEFVDRSVSDQPILDWVQKNTSEDDLIIGDDPVDLVFYLDHPAAASFSPYPYADYLTYPDLMSFLNRRCDQHLNFYLFVHKLKNSEQDWLKEFGPFITDLAMNRTDAYPNILQRIPHEESMIYPLRCGE